MLKEKRKESQLTQEQLAEKIYVTNRTVSNWETGKTTPDIESILRLSELFNLSLDELIKGDNNIMVEIKVDRKKLRRYKILKNILCVLVSLFVAYNIFWLVSIYPKNKNLNNWDKTEVNNYLKKNDYTFQAHKIGYIDPLIFKTNQIEVSTFKGTKFFMSMDKNHVHLMAYSSEGLEAILDKEELVDADFKILKGKFKNTNVSEIVNKHSSELKAEYNELEEVWKKVNNQ